MGRKSKADIRRKEIVAGCYRVVEKYGIERTTIKKIAEELGTAPSLIMHYFKNKDELLVQLVDYLVESMETVYMPKLQQFSTARERLDFFIGETISLTVAQSVEDRVFYACFYMSFYNPAVRKRFIAMYDLDRERSGRIIMDYLQEEGLPIIDPEPLSMEVIAFIEGLNFVYALYKDWNMVRDSINRFKKLFWISLEEQVEAAELDGNKKPS
ncbi:MAG: TetR family transcriptional regulator [Spirochaetales bacterium]|nr:TetR family transcriptional regulator [Spirochaetales bacterium]